MSRPHELEALIGYHLRRASSVMMADLAERLSRIGLTTTEASILVVLHEEAGISQSEIGRRLAIKRANMAPLIAGLVAREIIGRGDRVGRIHPLTLTSAGGKLAAEARKRMDEHDANFFGELSTDRRAQFQEFLSELWQRPIVRTVETNAKA